MGYFKPNKLFGTKILYNYANMVLQDQTLEVLNRVEQEILNNFNLFKQRRTDLQTSTNVGPHLMVPVLLNEKKVMGLIDTGAKKSTINYLAVEYCQMKNQLSQRHIKDDIQISGLGGNNSAYAFLYNVQLTLDYTELQIDLPVFQNQQFDILIGQDILYNLLYDVSIHIHKRLLRYKHSSGYRLVKLYTSEEVSSVSTQIQTSNYIKADVLFFNYVNTLNKQQCLTYFEETTQIFPNWPNKKYNFILVDLPIQYKPFMNSSQPYSCPTIQEMLKFMPLIEISEPDCIYLFWCSGALLPTVLLLLKGWNITFINILIVWVKLTKNLKNNIGLGYWTRSNIEFLIFAKRGKIGKFKSKQKNVSQTVYSYFDQVNKPHSTKPKNIYEVINKIFEQKNLKKIELFARQQTQYNSDYDVYGNEIENFFREAMVEKKVNNTSDIQVEYNLQINTLTNGICIKDVKLKGSSFYLTNLFITNINERYQQMYDKLKINPNFKCRKPIKKMFFDFMEVFSFNGEVGTSNVLQHSFKLKKYSQPIQEKPIPYFGPKAEFIKKEIDRMLLEKIIEPIKFPEFISQVVVAPKAEGKLRFCVNYQPINQLMLKDNYPLPLIERLILLTLNMKYFCTLDKQSGFHNIKNANEILKYLAFAVYNGVYTFLRMPFGLSNAPAEEQRSQDITLGNLNGNGAVSYLDDTLCYAQTQDNIIYNCQQTLQKFLSANLKLNPDKCIFFEEKVKFLGNVVDGKMVYPTEKKKQALLDFPVPKNFKQLQSFFGLLNYLSKYIPNLQAIQTSFKNLNHQKYKWTEVNQKTFDHLKQIMLLDTSLYLPEPGKTFQIYITSSVLAYGSILTQSDSGISKVVAYKSQAKSLLQLKQHKYISDLENLVYTLSDWKYYIYTSTIEVFVNDITVKKALTLKTTNEKMQNLQIELMPYKIIFKKICTSKLKFVQPLLNKYDSDNKFYQWAFELDKILKENQESILLDKLEGPQRQSFSFQFEDYDFVVFFDGACVKKNFCTIGSYAFVIKNTDQKIIKEFSEVYTKGTVTNNSSEMRALFSAIQHLQTNKIFQYGKILILGDSQLIINQALGIYRTNNLELRPFAVTIKKFLRKFKNVTLKWINRDLNGNADQLAKNKIQEYLKNQNYESSQDIEYNLYTTLLQVVDESSTCKCCKQQVFKNDNFVVCHHCGNQFHIKCVNLSKLPSYNYYCDKCSYFVNMLSFENLKLLDPYEDKTLYDLLQHKKVTIKKSQIQYYQKCAEKYTVLNNTLYFKDVDQLKRVPPIPERKIIIKQLHNYLGHIGQFKLLVLAKKLYYFPNMHLTIKNEVQTCLLCQAKHPKFFLRPSINPVDKGTYPFQYLSIDLFFIKGQIVCLGIDPFSKNLEGQVVKDKTCETILKFYQEQIVYRYGCPLVLRSDNGTEFLGKFHEYLQECGTLHIVTSPYFPSANGQVERTNRTIKDSLKAIVYDLENFDLQNILQLVLFSIRITIHRGTGFSPAQLLFGRDLLIPQHFKPLVSSTWQYLDQEDFIQHVAKLITHQNKIYPKVLQNLKRMDKEIKTLIYKRDKTSPTQLVQGQEILVKSESMDPLDYNVKGPCIFLKYNSQIKNSVIYYDPRTKRVLRASITNITPIETT